MRRLSLLAVFCALFLSACSTVPITGRSQLSLVSSDTILPMSFSNYNEFMSKNKAVHGTPESAKVKVVGTAIQHAVERYMGEHGMASRLKGYQWEFNLVDNKEVNAWCMPGGKVVVYSGILPVTKDDTGLAVVMGHEIAHAVASHGEERMSQGLLAQFGGAALGAAVASKPKETQDLYMTAFGLGAQVGVLLPYSRVQETEADHLGLIFMAMAGYDPNEAVGFWQRMSAGKQGGAPPEFLSTHPADQTRINNIRGFLPEAVGYRGR
ncbi:MAG: M48 family metallopeptidase [Nitrospirae bacterium]|nr:M48 family metallopeptidase [Nitrospirota bacterium]